MAIAFKRRFSQLPLSLDWSPSRQHLWQSCQNLQGAVDELEAAQKGLCAADRLALGYLIDRAYDELLSVERYAEGVK